MYLEGSHYYDGTNGEKYRGSRQRLRSLEIKQYSATLTLYVAILSSSNSSLIFLFLAESVGLQTCQ